MAARERYVLLGLARARAPWFRAVGQWATAAAIPADFVRAVSVAELRARLASGRAFSAVLVDGALGVDRDLVAVAREAGCPVIVVDDGHAGVDWRALGAAAVLPPGFSREDLLDGLEAHAVMVGADARERPEIAVEQGAAAGGVIAVCGAGGTGASTTAIALAQGLAQQPGPDGRHPPAVVLADLCRHADQAMLHDSRVVVPGIQELVEAHRSGVPRANVVRDQTFDVAARGYRLLLGLRRARHWVLLRPRAFEATMDSLQRCFDLVVCDVDPDVEGEAETGSVDIEERNLMARTVLGRAVMVVVVGTSDMKGLFSLVRVLTDLAAFGIPEERTVPVVSRAPRNPRQRADIAASLTSLLRSSDGERAARLASPVFLPERRIDASLRDGAPLPRPLPALMVGAFAALRERALATPPDGRRGGPQRVEPGSIGRFTAQELPRS